MYEIAYVSLKVDIPAFIKEFAYRDNFEDAHELFYEMLYEYKGLCSITIRNTNQNSSDYSRTFENEDILFLRNRMEWFKKSLIELEGI